MLKTSSRKNQKKTSKSPVTAPSGAVAHHARFTPSGRGK